MRVLITGASGFVGPYLARALRCTPDVVVIPTAKRAEWHPELGAVVSLDVTDQRAVRAAILHYLPTHVVHLAAMSVPASANAEPERAWRVHVRGTLNIADAILEIAPDCILVSVSSGLAYGASAETGMPMHEDVPLAPRDGYGTTKATADLALGQAAERGLRCVRLRPFNHAGQGQTEDFVLPALAMQVARIEAGLQRPVLFVGNTTVERDFLDVRDVTDAYVRAVLAATRLDPGTVFNVASGIPWRISTILDRLLEQSRSDITVRQDPARLRTSEVPCLIGDATRAKQLLGWTPVHRFGDTISAVLAEARARVADGYAEPVRLTRHS